MSTCASFAVADFKSELKPIWCPGCGDFGVLQATLPRARRHRPGPARDRLRLGHRLLEPHPRLHHGLRLQQRARPCLPIAQGIKIANPELLVLCAGGDGDGFSIGGGHLPHAIRRNLDLTYIVMDNQIYGLTKGQLSPTSPRGLRTVTSVFGSLEDPVNPLLYVLGYGARFVAQGTPADMAGLDALIEAAIRFPGFSFVNVQSPCITFGQPDQQLKAHKAGMTSLASVGHDPTNRIKAMDLAQAYGSTLYTGIFYQDPDAGPTYEEAVETRRTQFSGKPIVPRQRILENFIPR
jgi:2-oxoglutarate ferredoxin oxidoreductase subunit beta